MAFRRLALRMLAAKGLVTNRLHPDVITRLPNCKTIVGSLRLSSFQLKVYGKQSWRNNDGSHYVMPVLTSAVVAAASAKQDEDSELVHSMKLAVLSIQKGELEKAEKILHLSLRVAQEQSNAAAVTYIYDLLANIAFKQENFKKAERLLLELSRRLAASSTDDNAFVEVSLKLASVYASTGDGERAEHGFRYCIDTQQRKIDAVGEQHCDPDTLGLWGMAVDWYARFLTSRGQYSRARELTERALAVCVRLSGESGEQSVVLLNDLGTLDSLCEDYERAAERLSRAVQLATERGLPDLAAFHVNLGVVQLQQGLLREAERSCATGRRLAQRQGDDHTLDMASKCLTKVKALL
ncbi:tetratricopeptide repeat protein 19 homolog, mitochondrial-like isoform X1 [Pollicipes pollicipes]|uniref:tetratricopeptide repeat protein 19 homolog, mitochondrial-like isoform X1 n=2 Tax=Pollicipes pollicipes TaxID=41117 RepID=UPI001884F41E|nr:tetratricopeptide repeat protein 19 homolog, mitochondrial-like isoform X1 [Pollicipes pollicipes]